MTIFSTTQYSQFLKQSLVSQFSVAAVSLPAGSFLHFYILQFFFDLLINYYITIARDYKFEN